MVQLAEGDVLDNRYLIGVTIARGGMSTVYRATDLRLDREVAAKVMDPRFVDDDAFRIRFEREARAVARLSDESLVNVYDQGVDSAGHVFLIMEFVDGGTLRELLRQRGPMPPHAAAEVMRSVLRALSIAHSRQMIHRDVKPENVLISTSGAVKLADFGLVRAAADAKVTSNSVIVGTVAYISPEQVTGSSLTPASDVYSAGVLLFELLTGSTPFEADTSLGVAMKRLHEEVPAPSELIDGVPPEFDALVLRACNRDPLARFRDAAEFAEALEGIAAELALPPFRVPAPITSAAASAAAASPTAHTQTVGRHRQETAAEPRYPTETPERATPLAFSGLGSQAPALTPHQAPAVAAGETAIQPLPSAAAYEAAPAEAERQPAVGTRHAGRQRTRRGLALWIIIALIATLGMGLGAWWLGSGRYGEVPTITGLSEPAAMAVITEAGFEPTVAQRYHDTVTASQLIGTEPAAGSEVVRGEVVTVLVSRGQPSVPAYPANGSPAAYRTALSDRTLVEEVGEPEFSDDISPGNVVRAQPAPGTTVPVGSTVTVFYSKGPAPVTIPDVVGEASRGAIRRLERAGLEVSAEEEFDASAAADSVLRIEPPVGTELTRGSAVTVTVNRGVRLPNVVGKTESQARRDLQRAGFELIEARYDGNSTRPYDRVDRMSPAAGAMADPEGSAIVITVSRKVEVPRLVGRTVSEARREAERAHLELNLPADASDCDRVIWQDPRPGPQGPAGSRVSVRTF